jgi:hypothetical protein
MSLYVSLAFWNHNILFCVTSPYSHEVAVDEIDGKVINHEILESV